MLTQVFILVIESASQFSLLIQVFTLIIPKLKRDLSGQPYLYCDIDCDIDCDADGSVKYDAGI